MSGDDWFVLVIRRARVEGLDGCGVCLAGLAAGSCGLHEGGNCRRGAAAALRHVPG